MAAGLGRGMHSRPQEPHRAATSEPPRRRPPHDPGMNAAARTGPAALAGCIVSPTLHFATTASTTAAMTASPADASALRADAAPLRPFESLLEAADAMLEFLHDGADMALWMVNKVEDSDWVAFAVRDRHYGFERGARGVWADSLCARMANGAGPYIAPDLAQCEGYRDAPVVAAYGIGSYAGHPILDQAGHLFGTLCAVDPQPRAIDQARLLPRLALAARVLSTYITLNQQVQLLERRAMRAEHDSRTDPLTGVLNRRGWRKTIEAEQTRILHSGGSAGVVLADLDDLKRVNDRDGHEAGDELIRRFAQALSAQVRSLDNIARIGGDEFALLLPGARREGMAAVTERIRRGLQRAGIAATLGWGWAGVTDDLAQAVREADTMLLAAKPRRHHGHPRT